MIFESLNQSADNGELILVDGGFCRFHQRNDGQVTIYEIIVDIQCRREGIGRKMFEELKRHASDSIFAKCPTDLAAANYWYAKMGFVCERIETLKSGRRVNHWRYQI